MKKFLATFILLLGLVVLVGCTSNETTPPEQTEMTAAERKTDLTKAFVAFMMTTEGKATIKTNGGIVNISSNDKSWSTIRKNYPSVSKDNKDITLKFGGSTSVQKIAEALSGQFKGLAGNFIAEHNHTGSGDAFKRTQGSEKDSANSLDIGFLSRDFNDSEKQKAAGTYGALAQDAVVAVVNKNNPLTGLTKEQLKTIYSTKGNWNTYTTEKNGDIQTYTRDNASGTREAFLEVLGLGKSHSEGTLSGSQEATSNGDMINKVKSDSNAIGYISLSTLSSDLKGLLYEGVEATEDNVNAGTYKLKRTFNFITRNLN